MIHDTNGAEYVDYDSLGGCRALAIWVPVSAIAVALMGLGYWLGSAA